MDVNIADIKVQDLFAGINLKFHQFENYIIIVALIFRTIHRYIDLVNSIQSLHFVLGRYAVLRG